MANGKKNESTIRDLWDNIKWAISAHNIGIWRRRKRKGIENVFEEIMAENFPNLKKETDVQLQKAQRSQIRQNPNRHRLKHVILTMAKIKMRILKNGKRENVEYKGRITSGYQLISLQKHCRPESGKIYSKSWKGKNLQPRILYPARL